MKLISISLICIFFTFAYVHGQDLIISVNGSETEGKILEVDESIVYYAPKSDVLNKKKMQKSEVFMIIYEGGRRETFPGSDTRTKQPSASSENVGRIREQVLESGLFRLKLINLENESDRKANILRAEIEVYHQGAHFATLSAYTYQRTNKTINFSKPNRKLCARSRIVISSKTAAISNVLYQKYESELGRGYGWALPPGFLSPNTKACQVAFLDQKFANKEILGFGGISGGIHKLDNCETVEVRILSVVRLWLDVNFKAPHKV